MYKFDQSSSIVKGAGFFSISQNIFLPTTLYFGMSWEGSIQTKTTQDSGKWETNLEMHISIHET